MGQYIINPLTRRKVKIGSHSWCKLVSKGAIKVDSSQPPLKPQKPEHPDLLVRYLASALRRVDVPKKAAETIAATATPKIIDHFEPKGAKEQKEDPELLRQIQSVRLRPPSERKNVRFLPEGPAPQKSLLEEIREEHKLNPVAPKKSPPKISPKPVIEPSFKPMVPDRPKATGFRHKRPRDPKTGRFIKR